MSRQFTLRLARYMHTPGRQIPHPATPSTSPSLPHFPSSSTPTPSPSASDGESSLTSLPPIPIPTPSHSHPSHPSTASSSSSSPKFTPKGRPLPVRLPRTTRVTLASGYPEPPSYPPPQSYFDETERIKADLEGKKPAVHPLWSFFHVPAAAANLELSKDSYAPPDSGSLEALVPQDGRTGRSWTAAELREKSFADLHTLWYVLLRERNVLATQREERRRLGIPPQAGGDILTARAFRCRKSMSRIKYVLNERRLGLMAASPTLDGVLPPDVPFSAIPGSDPISGIDASLVEPDLAVLFAEERTGGHEVEGNGEGEAVSEEVSVDEVEARDEGFGGGQEAKEFVQETKVEEGKVKLDK